MDRSILSGYTPSSVMEEIILMDYLAGNVIGRIPSVDELNDVAKGLVSLQGIRAATKE